MTVIPHRNILPRKVPQLRPIFRRMAELCKPNIPPFSPWLTPTAKSLYLLADLGFAPRGRKYCFKTHNRCDLSMFSRPMAIRLLAPICLFHFAAITTWSLAAETLPTTAKTSNVAAIKWQSDYHAALDLAEANQQMVLVWFYDPINPRENQKFVDEVIGQQQNAELIAERYVPLRLVVSEKVSSAGTDVLLLDHPAFAEMRHETGLAVIDLSDSDSPLHRQVVSVYPFSRGFLTAEKLAVLLQLPRGTLTQRTLIYAVRTHPEFPASTRGHVSRVLMRETEKHARHQASIALQGHHNWDQRFHSINAELPGSLLAREVCAESWPGQPLVEAAEECVHSWRQSSGHWDAVRSAHLLFGYDMKRGSNGIWYAAGIFAGR